MTRDMERACGNLMLNILYMKDYEDKDLLKAINSFAEAIINEARTPEIQDLIAEEAEAPGAASEPINEQEAPIL